MVNGVLMSIKPAYADAIFAGTKTVELRRRRPSFKPGTRVLVYSSSPAKVIRGSFEAGDVIARDPDVLWDQVKTRAGVNRAAFDGYFDGCQTAYAIEVRAPKTIAPIRLTIRPPQSYLFLRPRQPGHSRLLTLATA